MNNLSNRNITVTKDLILSIVFAILLITYLIYLVGFLRLNWYLPAPFFFISEDTAMDWFNTVWHAYNDENVYITWRSVYTPLNLYLASVIQNIECLSSNSPLNLRECNFNLFLITYLLAILIFYSLLIFLQVKFNKKSAYILFFPISGPLLFSLERGNFVIFAAILLTAGFIVNNQKIKYILFGLAINFKIYILLCFMYYIKEKKNILIFIIISICIFFLGVTIYSDQSWPYFFKNLFIFSGGIDPIQGHWMPTSLGNYKFANIPIWIENILSIMSVFSKTLVLVGFYITFFKAKKFTCPELNFLITFLGISLLINIGYYSFILVYPIILILDINNKLTMFNKILIYIILVPVGIFDFIYIGSFETNSFISYYYYGSTLQVKKDLYLTFNSILIPMVSFLLYINLLRNLRITKYDA